MKTKYGTFLFAMLDRLFALPSGMKAINVGACPAVSMSGLAIGT
jgi:hypothetical protein